MCLCHVRVAKILYSEACPTVLRWEGSSRSSWNKASSCQFTSVLWSGCSILHIQVNQCHATNAYSPESTFLLHPFQIATRRYVNALHVIFASIFDADPYRFTLGEFNNMLRSQVHLLKTCTVIVLHIWFFFKKSSQFPSAEMPKKL